MANYTGLAAVGIWVGYHQDGLLISTALGKTNIKPVTPEADETIVRHCEHLSIA